MRAVVLIALLAITQQSCFHSKPGNQSQTDYATGSEVQEKHGQKANGETEKKTAFVINDINAESQSGYDIKTDHNTRLRFHDFEVVFYDFKGYASEAFSLSGDFGIDTTKVILNDFEKYTEEGDNPGYEETLIVKSDTAFLFEDLDERINNTLIQIIPSNKDDRFKLSFCYLSTLYEIFDYRKHIREEMDKLYTNALRISEQSKYYAIKDSADLFFRAMPHTPDMEHVTVVDGEIVPVKARNTTAQLTWEQKQYEAELKRIKKLYNLKDTLVVIPREYNVTATLTRESRLFEYMYDSFLFRIERYRNNKLQEIRYIAVGIMYGC